MATILAQALVEHFSLSGGLPPTATQCFGGIPLLFGGREGPTFITKYGDYISETLVSVQRIFKYHSTA